MIYGVRSLSVKTRFESGGRDGMADNFFFQGVPVKSLAAPVRLRGHNADESVRKAVVYIGVRLFSFLHRTQPVHKVMGVVVAWTVGVRLGRPRHMDYLCFILWRAHHRNLSTAGLALLLPSSFLAQDEERSSFAAIVDDGSFAPHDSAEAAIAVPEGGSIRVKEALWIRQGSGDRIRVLAPVFPDENPAFSHSADGI